MVNWTPNAVRRIRTTVQAVEQLHINTPGRPTSSNRPEHPTFFKLKAASLVSGEDAIWEYTGDQQRPKKDGTYEAYANGITDATLKNIREFGHETEPAASSKWWVWGVDHHAPIRKPLPVGYAGESGGSPTVDIIVKVVIVTISDSGERIFWFDAVGPVTPGLQEFPAIIAGSATLASSSIAIGGGTSTTVAYRWKYAWSEAEYSGDTLQVKSGGRSGTTTTDYAINRREQANGTTQIWDVNVTLSDYPENYRPLPIGGQGGAGTIVGHVSDTPVIMEQVIDINGDTRYYFSELGTHDGGCD